MIPDDQHQDSDAQTDTPETNPGRPAREALPEKIGQYVIKRKIASGGMGTIYEAMQENPRRSVAVKVINRNMASPEILRRFQREAQALARLRHPGIAQIYEAGTYEDAGISLPYFALEYIANARTIIGYARTKGLNVRQKLELFRQACEAVHYGHQRGIIHRDLKPGNILVDSEGRVRIIDFGVARAVDADQEQPDNQTRVGQIVGTPQYMSPEQFDADPDTLDTRSDVYALGVILYELLSDKLPYAIERSSLFEIARIVREVPPIALGSIVPHIDDEVALITSKGLEKDRAKRYQSAYGLAEDIRRYLNGEAIAAKTTDLPYQAKVFARKNKAVVGLAASVVALLIVGIAWTSKLYVDVRAARARAEHAAKQAIAANEFLKNALQAVVPPGFGDVRTIGDLCNQVLHNIDGAFPDDPLSEAEIRHTIGMIYSALDRRALAEQQLKKAYQLRRENLGAAHELSLQALTDLNSYYQVFGPDEKRLETAQEYYNLIRAKYGPDHEKTLDALEMVIDGLGRVGNFNEAERMALGLSEEVAARWGEDSPQSIHIQAYHAILQLQAGQVDAARTSGKEAYSLCGTLQNVSPVTWRETRNCYAATLLAAGDIEAAKELYGHRRGPDRLGIDVEYQGSLSALDEKVKILVFFETWCPYSQRYIPRVERLNRQYSDLGIEVVGLTTASRSSSDDKVRQFITDNDLTFSVLKDTGRSFNYFNISGMPWTVILHEGELIWESEGDSWLNSRMLEGIVSAKIAQLPPAPEQVRPVGR